MMIDDHNVLPGSIQNEPYNSEEDLVTDFLASKRAVACFHLAS